MNQPSPCALSVSGLSYAYSAKPALDNVSLVVEQGQCMILLGLNGAGKSTLFSLLTRLYESRIGRIEIGGFDLRRQSCQALACLGVVFQQPTLDLDLSVEQNLRYHAALHGMSRRQAQARINEELDRQGMSDRLREKARSLNGGHRRRVEIARALLHRPQVLLLDEPTVGLDVPSRSALVDHVHDLCRDRGIAAMWATHLIDEIHQTDALIVLHKGKIMASGALERVLASTDSPNAGEAFKKLTQTTA